MTFDRLTGIVSSSRTTVIVSGPIDLTAHSTNSWPEAEPTTRRSLSIFSGSAASQSAPGTVVSSSPACLQATLRTFATGISPRPSGRARATTLPSQAISPASIHDPSTRPIRQRPTPRPTSPSRSTKRRLSIGTTCCWPPTSIFSPAPSRATSVPDETPASVDSMRSDVGSAARAIALPPATPHQIEREVINGRSRRIRPRASAGFGMGARINGASGRRRGASPGARRAPVMATTRRRPVA